MSSSLPQQASTKLTSHQPAPPPRPADIFDLTQDGLVSLVTGLGEPAFRAKQLHSWVYDKRIGNFAEMKNLPKNLREQLLESATVGSMRVETELVSKDGTIKRLWKLHDGRLIESVLMPYKDGRRTACISSQVGCAMGCVFCATGQMGYTRQLTSGEIFEQVWRLSAELQQKGERLSNVVLMGMGEPFRNYDAVIAAVRRMQSHLGIGARHITISTVGIVPSIRRFAEEGMEVKLAISLHSSTDQERSALMPVNRKYPLEELREACEYYISKTNRRISFEWALIAGVNDNSETAHQLGVLLRGLLCHVNLIPLNPTSGYGGGPTNSADSRQFVRVLEGYGIPATVRVRRGIDIDAGCGQLANKAEKKAQAQADV